MVRCFLRKTDVIEFGYRKYILFVGNIIQVDIHFQNGTPYYKPIREETRENPSGVFPESGLF